MMHSIIFIFLGFVVAAPLALLSACVVGSLLCFLAFYVTELLGRTPDRPPIAGTILHMFFYFDTIFDFETEVARRLPTYRLVMSGHNEIFTTDPRNIEHMLSTNFFSYTKGKYNYDIMHDLFGDGIFTTDGEKWKHQRKLSSYEFSTKILRDYSSSVFRDNAVKLAKIVSDAAYAAAPIDMQDLFMRTTMDSIFKVGFGVDPGALSGSNAAGAQFSQAFDDANQIVFRRFVDLLWRVKRFFNIGLEARLKKDIKIIDDFVFHLIRQKRELMKNGNFDTWDKEDILSRFIVASEEEPDKITDRYLRDIILNFLIAGKDTSANTLTWFFYMMCKHPIIQEKVAREIKEATGFPDSGISIEEFASRINEEALLRMNYLHAALTETLRLYPAVPDDGKYANEDDILPDGFKVMKGEGLTYLAYAMGRMERVWGDDAEDFRPERWIENGLFKPQSPFKFIAFHGGPRLCLGKDFAYRQMKIVVTVLHFFRFKLVDESRNVRYKPMFTLHMKGGLPVFATH